MEFAEISFRIWLTFKVLFLFLIAVYIIAGLDDLIIDFTYYMRALVRRLFKSRLIKPVTREMLDSVPEKTACIIIPAWDESNVIARMLLNTASTLLYKNYYIFVGTYPNDEATKFEVEKIREVFSNIEVVVTPANGPTNKADCLNWVLQGILLFEKERNVHFDIFVFHDAEDVVHPLSMKYYNYLIPRVKFIQIPVFPFEREWWQFTTGCYMDEFAETHTKDLRAREVLAASIPSAGVGTALSREAVDYLAKLRNNQIFDIRSLTEDYMMGLLLKDMPGKKIFLQQSIERTVTRRSRWTGREYEVKISEPIATREFFPNTFHAAVRQKARWILGISLQGWMAGWSSSLGLNYCLWRDRKAVAANLMVIFGYIVVGYWALTKSLAAANPEWAVPPLVDRQASSFKLIYFVIGLFAWRMFNRAYAVYKIYNLKQALLSMPRLFWGNIINFCATWQAIRRYIQSRISGKVPEWGKTAHAYPSEDQLRSFHRKLGDLLLERRLITTAQLEAAVEEQKRTGKKLGEVLLNMGALWEEDLVLTLAHQKNEKAVELDPHGTPPELLKLVPKTVAEKYRVFPLALKGETLVLASDSQDRDRVQRDLSVLLNRPVTLNWTSGADLQFAITRAYRPAEKAESAPVAATDPGDRLGQRLVREGIITQEDLTRALRRQKRTHQKLGEVLLEMKLVTHKDLGEELNRA